MSKLVFAINRSFEKVSIVKLFSLLENIPHEIFGIQFGKEFDWSVIIQNSIDSMEIPDNLEDNELFDLATDQGKPLIKLCIDSEEPNTGTMSEASLKLLGEKSGTM